MLVNVGPILIARAGRAAARRGVPALTARRRRRRSPSPVRPRSGLRPTAPASSCRHRRRCSAWSRRRPTRVEWSRRKSCCAASPRCRPRSSAAQSAPWRACPSRRHLQTNSPMRRREASRGSSTSACFPPHWRSRRGRMRLPEPTPAGSASPPTSRRRSRSCSDRIILAEAPPALAFAGGALCLCGVAISRLRWKTS